MIQTILEAVAKEFSATRSELSFALVNGGIYRDRSAYRNIVLIYRKKIPFIVAKYCTSPASIRHEAEILQAANKKQIPSPKFQRLLSLNGQSVLLEEYLDGISLQELLNRRLLSPESAINYASNILDQTIKMSRENSSKDALLREIESLLARLEQFSAFKECEGGFAISLKEKVFEILSRDECCTSITHGDFIARNILLVDDSPFIFDFEFSRQSHFAVADWFRFFMYAAPLKHFLFHTHGVIDSMFERFDPPSSLRSFLNRSADVPYLKLLAYSIDFQTRVAVCPAYLHANLAHGFRDCLQEFANIIPGIKERKSNVISLQETVSSNDEGEDEASVAKTSSKDSYNMLVEEYMEQKTLHQYDQTVLRLKRRIEEHEYALLKKHRVLEEVQELVKRKDQDLAHRDLVINSIATSPAFRIGKAITGLAKKIPGIQRRRSGNE